MQYAITEIYATLLDIQFLLVVMVVLQVCMIVGFVLYHILFSKDDSK